jgi:hypothetical protein
MGDWTADLLFKADVAVVKRHMVNEKQGNHDKNALDYSMEKEKEKEIVLILVRRRPNSQNLAI